MQLRNKNKNLEHIYLDIEQDLNKIDSLLKTLQKEKKTKVLHRIDNTHGNQNKPTLALQLKKNNSKRTDTLGTEDEQEYQFYNTYNNQSEEMLLDTCTTQYNPEYLQELSLTQPLQIDIATRSNWIKRYLDENDCSLHAENNGELLQILGIENGMVSYMNPQNQFQKMNSQQVHEWTNLQATFQQHLTEYQLHTVVRGKTHLYEVNLHKTMRIIVKARSQDHNIKRVLLVKEINDNCSKYEVAWGNYFQKQIVQDVKLEKGKYILLTLGSQQLESLSLIVKNAEDVTFRTAQENHTLTRSLLMQTFPECQSLKDSLHSDRSIKQEFSRRVYMDIGLVIQVYQNIYLTQAKFQDEQTVVQDINLLFPELYSPKQLQNRLDKGQRMVKFFSIEAKPARLFVPKKQVLTNSQLMQNFKSHSVFK